MYFNVSKLEKKKLRFRHLSYLALALLVLVAMDALDRLSNTHGRDQNMLLFAGADHRAYQQTRVYALHLLLALQVLAQWECYIPEYQEDLLCHFLQEIIN